MENQEIKVEVDAHDPTLIYINGKKYTSSSVRMRKIDSINHVERVLFHELNEKQYSDDLKTIVNTLKKETTTTELLTEIMKDLPPRIIKRIAKRIRDKQPIKKHHGCLGFKIGDAYIQIAGGLDY